MPTLLDSSVYNALAKYRLLNEALAVYGITRANVFVLNELRFQLRDNRNRNGKPILDPASLQFAKDFYDDVGGDPPQPLHVIPANWVDSQDHKLLNVRNDNVWHGTKRVKVDGGEATLFAATKNLPTFSIWTADVKSLIALPLWPGCYHIYQRILGKVYCLERIIRDLVQARGFANIAPKIGLGFHAIDRAIAQGDGECHNALLAIEAQHQRDCKGLLVA